MGKKKVKGKKGTKTNGFEKQGKGMEKNAGQASWNDNDKKNGCGFEKKGKGMEKDAGQASWNDNDKRCLYICTIEIKAYKVAYVIHAIKLSDLLSSCTSKLSGLSQVAYMDGEDLCGHVGCGLFGSKILFAGGLEPNREPDDAPNLYSGRFLPDCLSSKIYAFDTTESDMKPQMFENFQGGKCEPLLVELQGKLYALAGMPDELIADPFFEVFDPTVGKWSTLADPPFLDDQEFSDYWAQYFSYATFRNTIAVSTPNKHYIFCFDVTTTHQEWGIVAPFMFQGGPFPFHGRALVVDDDDDQAHRAHLIFTYQYTAPEPIVVYVVYFNKMETIKSLEMPDGLPPEFQDPPYSYRFAYLGDQKVCLVITQFMFPSISASKDQYEKMRVLVLTLQFSKTKGPNSERDVQFLGSPCIFEYDTRRSEPEKCRTVDSKLLGCFVR